MPKFPDSEEIALYIQNCPESLDMLDMLNAIKNAHYLQPAQIAEIAEMLEICPIHFIALEICADDENAECAHLYSDAPESPELSSFDRMIWNALIRPNRP